MTPAGVVTTLWSGGSSIRGLALSTSGDAVFVADQLGCRIRRVTTAGGIMTTHAFAYQLSAADGEALNVAGSWYPGAVAYDPSGVVYLAEWFAPAAVTELCCCRWVLSQPSVDLTGSLLSVAGM